MNIYKELKRTGTLPPAHQLCLFYIRRLSSNVQYESETKEKKREKRKEKLIRIYNAPISPQFNRISTVPPRREWTWNRINLQ